MTGILENMLIFVLVWWMVLFTVLPWRRRKAHSEDGTAGESETDRKQHDPAAWRSGAPSVPLLGLKFAATTVIAVVIFACIHLVLFLWY